MQRAYFAAGDREQGIQDALTYGAEKLGLQKSADVIIERYGLFSVEDARRVIDKALLAPIRGDKKLYVIAANRIFHEAQNALLKLFEEPPKGTTLVLVLPSEGDLLYTLRSRLLPLPVETEESPIPIEALTFAKANEGGREKLVAELLDEAKSDDDEEKQEARAKALRLAEGLARAAYKTWRKESGPDSRDRLYGFLRDLDRLIPVLHDRAAPLKPILEHILIIAPKKLA